MLTTSRIQLETSAMHGTALAILGFWNVKSTENSQLTINISNTEFENAIILTSLTCLVYEEQWQIKGSEL